MPRVSTTRRTTPLIWPLLAVLILWAGIALLAWLLWNGKQVSLRSPRQNFCYESISDAAAAANAIRKKLVFVDNQVTNPIERVVTA